VSENPESLFLAGFDNQGALNKHPMIWLDEARPPSKVLVKDLK